MQRFNVTFIREKIESGWWWFNILPHFSVGCITTERNEKVLKFNFGWIVWCLSVNIKLAKPVNK